jgi:hypothetical protein
VCVFKQTTSTCDSSSNSSTWNCAASNSKVWGTRPQSFYWQLLHLTCSV